MPKAHITTKSGAKITIEGTPEEVAALVTQLEGRTPAPQRKRETTTKGGRSSARITATSLIVDLIDGGFFKKPKELSAIKVALEEQGHYYPVTSLSPVVLRLVRKRQLRRMKDKKRWLYVN